MARIWIGIACWLSGMGCMAQNLVPNGSFEEHDDCPTSDGQMNYATGWDAYIYSPDFWHTCGIPYQSAVPSNIAGYQQPRSGQGYAGIHAFTGQGQSADGYREILGAQLIEPLLPGNIYHVAFSVSWTTSEVGGLVSMQYANNKIGALFSTYMRSGFAAWYPLPNYAHVYAEEIITDSVGWTLVEGDFIADSAYTYVYLGNFFGDAETEDTLINPGGMFGLSYYYLDDVCVTPVGGECGVVGVAEEPLADAITISPNPFEREVWLQGASGMQELTVCSLTGAVFISRRMLLSAGGTPLDLSELPSGTYLLTLTANRQEQRRVLLVHE